MKKYIYTMALALCGWGALSMASCSDDDFNDKPKTIDINDVILTPINGGCEVQWTPDPEDNNFVFLHVEFTDHDNNPRSYNVSRYGSELVTPFIKDKDGNIILNEKGEAVKTVIKDLINQEYTLHFYAYNNENNRIDLGSRTITPLDYKQCVPDSIFSVSIVAKGGRRIISEWKEPKIKTSSTSDKVFFRFNFDNGKTETKTINLGVRHAEFILENSGKCTVEYGTVSAVGKEWSKKYKGTLNVVKFYNIELWEAKDKTGWTATCESEYSDHDQGTDKLIDGDINTFWSCNWEATHLDKYEIIITLPEEQDIVGIILQQRQGGQDAAGIGWWRMAKHFSVEAKQNGAEEYTPIIEQGTLTDEGATDKDNIGTAYLAKQSFDFESVFRTKEIRLCVWEPLNADFTNEPKNLCMGEFGILIKDPNKSDE